MPGRSHQGLGGPFGCFLVNVEGGERFVWQEISKFPYTYFLMQVWILILSA